MIAELFAVSPQWSANFLFIFARLSAALVVLPIFGARGVPGPAKAGLAVLFSLIVLPLQQDAQLSAAAAAATDNLLIFASKLGSDPSSSSKRLDLAPRKLTLAIGNRSRLPLIIFTTVRNPRAKSLSVKCVMPLGRSSAKISRLSRSYLSTNGSSSPAAWMLTASWNTLA